MEAEKRKRWKKYIVIFMSVDLRPGPNYISNIRKASLHEKTWIEIFFQKRSSSEYSSLYTPIPNKNFSHYFLFFLPLPRLPSFTVKVLIFFPWIFVLRSDLVPHIYFLPLFFNFFLFFFWILNNFLQILNRKILDKKKSVKIF